jgi:hypothetical protein
MTCLMPCQGKAGLQNSQHRHYRETRCSIKPSQDGWFPAYPQDF